MLGCPTVPAPACINHIQQACMVACVVTGSACWHAVTLAGILKLQACYSDFKPDETWQELLTTDENWGMQQ